MAVLPSFEAQRCWSLEYRPSRDAPPRAELVVCDIHDDYERFLAAGVDGQTELLPRLSRATYEVPLDTLRAIEQLVAGVAVPLVMDTAPSGTDGTRYLLERRAGFNRLSVEWWRTGPRDWSTLTACFQSIWSMLDGIAGRVETP